VGTYRVVDEERDLIPMTDHVAPRRVGARVLNIGTRGGRVKASSGYAFERTQRDAIAITGSLRLHGHPFALPQTPGRYRTFGTMLLHVVQRHAESGRPIILRLFRNNPVQRIFRFLDEDGDWRDNLALMATVPPLPFIRAWLSTRVTKWA
jgi:lycopene beta-cyclase